MYIRTQIQLDERYYQLLRDKAHRERTSLSALIRKSVELLFGKDTPSNALEQKKKQALAIAGRFKADVRDGARRHDDYLLDVYRK